MSEIFQEPCRDMILADEDRYDSLTSIDDRKELVTLGKTTVTLGLTMTAFGILILIYNVLKK